MCLWDKANDINDYYHVTWSAKYLHHYYSTFPEEYRIAGKFGKEFNLVNWRGIERIAKLKIAKL